MKKANYNDKDLIVEILTKPFDTNQSVNYIVKQDEKDYKIFRFKLSNGADPKA